MVDDQNAIVGWIVKNCLQEGTDADIDVDTPLLPDLLDSIKIIDLVNFIESHFHVKIEVEDLVPENFETVNGVIGLLQKRRGQS